MADQLPKEAEVWIMAHKFDGCPKPTDFQMITEPLGEVPDGGIMAEAEIWSVDPFNRAYAREFPDGTPMIGFQMAKVIASKNSDYPVGEHIVGLLGWRTHAVLDAKKLVDQSVYKLPSEVHGLPLSFSVGALGMPGMTAYFGLLDLCKPKAGETVVVNAAAGAVGCLVGQIAKIKECNVIGYAGSDDKCDWLKQDLCFDHAFNYKTKDLDETLKRAAPNGVDCFFDNVSGLFAQTVHKHMNRYGRICQCGAISGYNATGEGVLVPDPMWTILGKELQVFGFLVPTYFARFQEGITQMAEWIKDGKIKYREYNYTGFKTMPRALIEQLEGKNTGKVIIKKN